MLAVLADIASSTLAGTRPEPLENIPTFHLGFAHVRSVSSSFFSLSISRPAGHQEASCSSYLTDGGIVSTDPLSLVSTTAQ